MKKLFLALSISAVALSFNASALSISVSDHTYTDSGSYSQQDKGYYGAQDWKYGDNHQGDYNFDQHNSIPSGCGWIGKLWKPSHDLQPFPMPKHFHPYHPPFPQTGAGDNTAPVDMVEPSSIGIFGVALLALAYFTRKRTVKA